VEQAKKRLSHRGKTQEGGGDCNDNVKPTDQLLERKTREGTTVHNPLGMAQYGK